ncbi:MAG: GH1 family beta-glucosidase [Actinomycetes bacterium]
MTGTRARMPEGFLWGAATASYQIEGAVDEDGRGPSIWDTFSATPGAVRHGDTGAIACDHYHRWETDLDLLTSLGLSAYRFSIAWPRVQPDGCGEVNQKGLDFYARLADGLRDRGIEPVATLYHWDLPLPLQEDSGGWASRETAERFAAYAALVHEALGDRITRWITLNEPWVSSFLGYGAGVHAPGVRDGAQALAAAHHLLLGHGLAVQALRAGRHSGEVGITLNLAPTEPAGPGPADVAASRRVDANQNRWFTDPLFLGSYPEDLLAWYDETVPGAMPEVRDGDMACIATPLDLLGVNYYFRQHVRAGGAEAPREVLPSLDARQDPPDWLPRTAMAWPVEADGLRELLVRLHTDYDRLPPVYITENGCAYDDYVDPEGGVDDLERIDYLDGHLRAVAAAVAEGVDVRGYFAWSLLDNFEWAEGYAKRFGLHFVDYRTQRRIPKASAVWYRDVVARNGLP